MNETLDETLPGPRLLSENPELAPLRILQTTLAVAEQALVAAYPGEGSDRGLSEPEAYVIAILHQIGALEALLERYAESIRRLVAWRNREPPGDEIPF